MLSFRPSEDETVLVDLVRRFAQDRVRPAARQCEEAGSVPDDVSRSFWDLGLGLMNHAPEVGGAGLGQRAAVLAEEELAWGDPTIAVALPRPGLAGDVVSAFDLRTQSRWLAPFSAPECRFGAAALFDSRADSRWIGTVKVTPADGDFLLQGQSRALPAAGRADWVLVAGWLDGDLALFAAAREAAGVVFAPEEAALLGLRGAGCGTMELDRCRVDRNVLLARGKAAGAALAHGLKRDLLVWAARLVGVGRAALEYAVEYATQRRTFGRRLAEHQAIAFMVADMGTAIDAARCLLWHAAWAFDREVPAAADLTVSALSFAAESAVRATSDAVQILGGHGYIQDHPVEKWLRDARTMANVSAHLGQLLAWLENGR